MENENNVVYKVSGSFNIIDICFDIEESSDSAISIYDNIHYESDCESFVRPEYIFKSKQSAIVRFDDYRKKYFQLVYYAFVDSKKFLADEDLPDFSVIDNGGNITFELAEDNIYRENGLEKFICSGGKCFSKCGDDIKSIRFEIRLKRQHEKGEPELISWLMLEAQPKANYKEEDIIQLEYAESEYGPQQSFYMGRIKDAGVTEPIEWIFVRREKDKALVVSKKGLFIKPYDDKVTEDGEHPWNNSTLRKWLNTDFYDMSFSKEEKERILFCDDEEENIHEKIFLLSAADVVSDFPRLWICEPCALLAPHVSCICENRLPWYLRDMPNYNKYGCHYRNEQFAGVFAADFFGWPYVEKDSVAVRPAMWISLK